MAIYSASMAHLANKSFYEGSVRVPMLWAGPNIATGRRIDAPTSVLDLGPSLIGVAGGVPMIDSDGVDLWPGINGSDASVLKPDRAIISQLANRGKAQLPTAMIRRGADKLVCHGVDDQRWQLFDVVLDPDEHNDRGIDPSPKDQELIGSLRAGNSTLSGIPEAADQRAKASTHHMRRLWTFDSNHPLPSNAGWTGDFDETRQDLPGIG